MTNVLKLGHECKEKLRAKVLFYLSIISFFKELLVMAKQIKVVIVGEPQSGKTTLWQSCFLKKIPKSYIETVFDNYTTNLFTPNGTKISTSLFELSGEDNYKELRKIVYKDANIILLCVPADDPEILTRQEKCSPIEKWQQELKELCRGVPVIVVGTKTDIRNNPDRLQELHDRKLKPLKLKDFVSISKKFKSPIAAVECSAIQSEGLEFVLNSILTVYNTNPKSWRRIIKR